jgi:hypothetical protein
MATHAYTTERSVEEQRAPETLSQQIEREAREQREAQRKKFESLVSEWPSSRAKADADLVTPAAPLALNTLVRCSCADGR